MKIDFMDAYSMGNTDDDDEPKNNDYGDNNKKGHPPHDLHEKNNFLPVYEGKLPVAFSNGKLEYHISKCYNDNKEEREFIDIALRTCKIACIATDISRGRPISPVMSQLLTRKCIDKLTNMWKLVDEYLKYKNDAKSRAAFCNLPPIPNLVNGMFVSPNHFEGVVKISAGPVQYWLSLVLELRQNKWICTYADLG